MPELIQMYISFVCIAFLVILPPPLRYHLPLSQYCHCKGKFFSIHKDDTVTLAHISIAFDLSLPTLSTLRSQSISGLRRQVCFFLDNIYLLLLMLECFFHIFPRWTACSYSVSAESQFIRQAFEAATVKISTTAIGDLSVPLEIVANLDLW
jgi:hypothetical protein